MQVSHGTLQILLEYAYAGSSHQGGSCHVAREEGCPLCDAFTETEAIVYVGERDGDMDRNWFEEESE